MKVGIITLNDYQNFGNRLQNYASECLLREFGCDVETICIYRDINRIMKKNRYKLEKVFRTNIYSIVWKIREMIRKREYKEKYRKREERFHQFSDKYLTETEYMVNKDKKFEEIEEKFDAFFVGSDQVWNPNYEDGRKTFYLPNIKKKKIALAASFGISLDKCEIGEQEIELIRRFSDISVREESAVNYLKNVGIEATLLADPTLLLETSKWEKLISEKRESTLPEEYVLVYFLGPVSIEIQKRIKQIAKRDNLKIIDIMDPKTVMFEDMDPIYFLQYIRAAKIIFTDSFHACVFSIIFKRPFIVSERKTSSQKLSSRIDTLLNMFALNDRKYECIDWENIYDVDFENNEETILNLQIRGRKFIKKALV
ncbi:polysaccharide pyruvyl transferase family protein [Laedolimicola intestinihominis]|uniref:Polysaccharide pyruvyl transferase family protein n=1 Tax=Laedolimicola intestinihominis TaxID=3133166 RepID=A0ABV1FF02_9FIRM